MPQHENIRGTFASVASVRDGANVRFRPIADFLDDQPGVRSNIARSPEAGWIIHSASECNVDDGTDTDMRLQQILAAAFILRAEAFV